MPGVRVGMFFHLFISSLLNFVIFIFFLLHEIKYYDTNLEYIFKWAPRYLAVLKEIDLTFNVWSVRYGLCFETLLNKVKSHVQLTLFSTPFLTLIKSFFLF